jgi:hypothetical protein
MNLIEFFSTRAAGGSNFIPAEGGSGRTVMITSHIWWMELMAYAMHRLGYNVLVTEPLYLLYTEDDRFANFQHLYKSWIQAIRHFNVQLIIGGNSAAMVPNLRTGELLHHAVGVPVLHYWWDEIRKPPVCGRRGYDMDQYYAAMRDPMTLNVLCDIDVQEELAAFHGITNTIHVPVGTTPEFWPAQEIPMEQRLLAACFIGNCGHVAGQAASWLDESLGDWAGQVVDAKLADPMRSMVDCISAVTPDTTVLRDGNHWGAIGAKFVERVRNPAVMTLARQLGGQFVLIGKGWEGMGLKAHAADSGVPHAAKYYTNARGSLNASGGCMHGGLTLRAFDIAASNGLLITPMSRELPDCFEPGRECLAFRDADDLASQIDRLMASPAEYNTVVAAGRRRVLAEHTWERRMARLLDAAAERLDLPWHATAAPRPAAA